MQNRGPAPVDVPAETQEAIHEIVPMNDGSEHPPDLFALGLGEVRFHDRYVHPH